MKSGSNFVQAYKRQAAVDAESQVIVAQSLSAFGWNTCPTAPGLGGPRLVLPNAPLSDSPPK